MAALVRIATNLRAVLASHVPFQLMDRRCLRSPHDVEGNGLVGVAAQAFHFEIAVPGIEGAAQRGRWLRRTLKAEHALVPRLAGEPVGVLACLGGPLCRCPDRCAVNGLARLCAHAEGCARSRETGKPLQIAVDDVTGTTEATKPTGCGRSNSRASDGVNEPKCNDMSGVR